MSVDVRWPPASATLGGRTYYFCALECKQAFLEFGPAHELDAESKELVDRHGKPLAAPRIPSSMVTILFSDIEASTVLMEEMGQQAAHAAVQGELERQERTVKRHGGNAVKRLGDGMMAAFPAARSALLCAIEIQSDHLEGAMVPVRIGMHTGHVIVDGDDYFGKTVAMAARLTARARGGEILLTDGLRSLLDPPEGWRFGSPQRVRLKGFSGWQRIVGVECCRPEPESR
jgi:class 3 adenylate cyclase